MPTSPEIRASTTLSYLSCSLDGQDDGRRTYFDHGDAVEATRTVRESSERAAAAAASTGSVTAPLTGSGNTGSCMYRSEAHQVAADQHLAATENNSVQPPEMEIKLEPEMDRLSLEGAENCRLEFSDDTFRGASATVAHFSDTEECCLSQSNITSLTSQAEVVTRRPVAAVNRKSSYQEPRSERFDRVVQYFDSRHQISGKLAISLTKQLFSYYKIAVEF